MEMLRLYHSIWRLPDRFLNRSKTDRTAPDFGFAMTNSDAS